MAGWEDEDDQTGRMFVFANATCCRRGGWALFVLVRSSSALIACPPIDRGGRHRRKPSCRAWNEGPEPLGERPWDPPKTHISESGRAHCQQTNPRLWHTASDSNPALAITYWSDSVVTSLAQKKLPRRNHSLNLLIGKRSPSTLHSACENRKRLAKWLADGPDLHGGGPACRIPLPPLFHKGLGSCFVPWTDTQHLTTH